MNVQYVMNAEISIGKQSIDDRFFGRRLCIEHGGIDIVIQFRLGNEVLKLTKKGAAAIRARWCHGQSTWA